MAERADRSRPGLSVGAFRAFYLGRPEEERWELIEGVAVMNPAPIEHHQMVVSNIVAYLIGHKRQTGARWFPMLGVGTRVPDSPHSLPQPDVFVKEEAATDRPVTDDALVLFEVLSRSNTRVDQAWRRRVYASVPNCQHYVTVSLKAAEVVAYDRASNWHERTVASLDEPLALPALGLAIPLADIYRWTPLGQGATA